MNPSHFTRNYSVIDKKDAENNLKNQKLENNANKSQNKQEEVFLFYLKQLRSEQAKKKSPPPFYKKQLSKTI